MSKLTSRLLLAMAPLLSLLGLTIAPLAASPAAASVTPTVTVPAAADLGGSAPTLYKTLTGGAVISISGFDPATNYRAILSDSGAFVSVSRKYNNLMTNSALNDGAHHAVTFVGTPSQINKALATATLASSGQPGTLKVSVGDANLFTDPETGFSYAVVNCGGCSWNSAYSAVASNTYAGMQGYLFSPRSAHQDEFVADLVSTDSWMGASDDYTKINVACGNSNFTGQGTGSQAANNAALSEGKWFWVTGPMKCTRFFTETAGVSGYPASGGGGNVVNNEYNGWANGEPNNWGGSENYSEKYANSPGWNDYGASMTLQAYIVQYGGTPGDNPTTSDSASASTDIGAAPGAPGTPTISDWWSGNSYITVEIAPPASDGGSPVTGYTVVPYQVLGHKVDHSASCSQTWTNGSYSDYECTGVQNFKKYSFMVSATNAYGTGGVNDLYRNNGGYVTPEFNHDVDNVNVTGLSTADVSWYAPADNIVAYKVLAMRGYNRIGGSCTVTVSSGTAADPYSCTVRHLKANEYFSFQLQIKMAGGKFTPVDNDCWDCYYSATTGQRPGDVTGIRARSNHNGSMDVWFNSMPGSYNSVHTAYAYTDLGVLVTSCSMGYGYESNGCTLNGLTQGVKYKIYVVSENTTTNDGFTPTKKSLSIHRIA